MKNSFYLLLILLLFSCKSEEEIINDALKNSFRNDLAINYHFLIKYNEIYPNLSAPVYATDRNSELKIKAIYLTSLHTINENQFDSLQILNYENLISCFQREADNIVGYVNDFRLGSYLFHQLNTWPNNYTEDDYAKLKTIKELQDPLIKTKYDINMNLYHAKLYNDSCLKYKKINSTLSSLIDQRKNPKILYKCSFKIDAELTYEGEIIEKVDSYENYFDSDFSIKKLDDHAFEGF